MKKIKKDDIFAIGGAFLLTLIISSLIYMTAGRFPGQTRLFLDGDSYYQYMQFFRMFWRHLLNGGSLRYSFESSLGMQTAAAYGGSCLSPFNIFFAFFSDANTAAFVAVVCKLAVSAAAFSLLLRKSLDCNPVYALIFSVAYALCGYSINFYTIISFLDALYVLPVLMMVMYRFVKKGRWGWLSILYAYIFIVQAYMGYVLGLFSAGVYLLLAWAEYGKEVKKWAVSIGKYVFSVICAVMMSMFCLLPQAYWIMNYTPEDSTVFEGLRFYIWELPGMFFMGESQGIYNIHPMAYAGLPVLFLVPAYFSDKKIERSKRIKAGILILALVLSTVWGPFYLLLHGFDNPDSCAFRYSFLWPFVMLFLSAWELQKGEKNKVFWMVTGGSWILIYGALMILQGGRLSEKEQTLNILLMEVNAVFLAAYLLVFLYVRSEKKKSLVFALILSLELVANGFFILTPDADTAQRSRWYYNLWQHQAEDSLKQIDKLEEDDPWQFYRVYYDNAPMENFPMLYGYHGVGIFSTLEYERVRNELMKLGYATSVKIISDYGSTPLMRMLLAQRYTVVAGHPRIGDPEQYSVSKNDETLPLGFMVSDKLLGYSADKSSAFENLNSLASAMAGETIKIFVPYEGELTVETDGMSVTPGTEAVTLNRDTETDRVGMAVYRVKTEASGRFYAYFYRGSGSYKDAASPTVFSTLDAGQPNQVPYLSMLRIFPLGQNDEGEYEAVIYMYPEGYQTFTYDVHFFATEDVSERIRLYDMLKDNTWKIQSFTDERIEGSIVVDDEKTVLFTSIPYDEGWKAYVDGAAWETVAVMDGAFLALKLPQGEHSLVLEYHISVEKTGVIISMIGIAAWIIGMTVCYGVNKRKNAAENEKK